VDSGDILGKPVDTAEAVTMLTRLRGHSHQVYTGIAALRVADGKLVTDLCVTDVPMRLYSDEEIEAYTLSGDPLDKAGAYAIQHPGFRPVEKLNGCYASVMGLPMCHVMRALRKFDLSPQAEVPLAIAGALRDGNLGVLDYYLADYRFEALVVPFYYPMRLSVYGDDWGLLKRGMLRDMSVIHTPPADRLSIRTQVARFSESMVREAVLREVRRGGQVFFVHNRVQTIGALAETLARVVPEARVLVAHGQMRGRFIIRQTPAAVTPKTMIFFSSCSAKVHNPSNVPLISVVPVMRTRSEEQIISMACVLPSRISTPNFRAPMLSRFRSVMRMYLGPNSVTSTSAIAGFRPTNPTERAPVFRTCSAISAAHFSGSSSLQ
jgi:hypothetical protein